MSDNIKSWYIPYEPKGESFNCLGCPRISMSSCYTVLCGNLGVPHYYCRHCAEAYLMTEITHCPMCAKGSEVAETEKKEGHSAPSLQLVPSAPPLELDSIDLLPSEDFPYARHTDTRDVRAVPRVQMNENGGFSVTYDNDQLEAREMEDYEYEDEEEEYEEEEMEMNGHRY